MNLSNNEMSSWASIVIRNTGKNPKTLDWGRNQPNLFGWRTPTHPAVKAKKSLLFGLYLHQKVMLNKKIYFWWTPTHPKLLFWNLSLRSNQGWLANHIVWIVEFICAAKPIWFKQERLLNLLKTYKPFCMNVACTAAVLLLAWMLHWWQ